MITNPKITFDLDGVLCDNTNDILMAGMKTQFGRDRVHREYDENTNLLFSITVDGASQNEIHKSFASIIECTVPLQNPSKWSQPVLKWVQTVTSLPITILSARNESTRDATCRWLATWYPNIDFKVVLNPNGGKAQYCLDHNVGIHVDDRYKTIVSFIETNWPRPVMYNREWNKGRDTYRHDGTTGYTRINDLRGIIPLLCHQLGLDQFTWPTYVLHPVQEEIIKTTLAKEEEEETNLE